MAIKLNVNRTENVEVPVPLEDGKFKSFFCEMRILKETDDKETRIVDLIVGIKGLELSDENGRVLTNEETIKAVKSDGKLKGLIINAWNLGNEIAAMKQRTYLERSDT